MRISNNITIYAGSEQQAVNGQQEEQQKQGKKSVFAGYLNSDLLQNQIQQKKEEAQKKAMKIVTDVWESERVIEEDLQERREKIDALKQEKKQAKDKISEISEEQEAMKEIYGITEDCKEQQDLELLRKKNNILSGKGGSLSPEEWEYTARLEQEGLTEYQLRQLDMDREKQIYEEKVTENDKAIFQELAIIRGTRLERLKYDPMVKAQKQADAVLDAASKEIIGMVVEDAKEHIDEEKEERQEQAEVIEEKREQQEALIEARKEEREEQEELLEAMPVNEMLTLDQTRTDIKKEIQNIINEMKLVAEDIKGSVVDETL